MDFDVGKAADWVDTEGHVGIVGKAVRVTVVQKEIAPLEKYGRYVSVTFNVTCTVEKHGPCWEVRHLGTLDFLEAIEPFVLTANKKDQIAKARAFYAERAFRRLFGEELRGGRNEIAPACEAAALMAAIRRVACFSIDDACCMDRTCPG